MYDNVKTNNAFFRQLLFVLVLIFFAAVIFKQLAFFLGSFLGAITLYVVFRGILFNLTEKRGLKRWVASTIIVIAASIILLGLGFLVFEIAASKISTLDLNTSNIGTWFNGIIDQISEKIGIELGAENIFSQGSSIISKIASSVFNTTYSFVINVFLMLVILYFMLLHGRRMESKVFEYIPFKGDSLSLIKTDIRDMIFSNAVGIPLIMISQGIAAYILFWAYGIDNPIFWAFLTALCGLIPMIGTALVTAPMGIYLMASGHIWGGIIMIFCGLFVVANVDNLVRIILLKKYANTHPLIVIFGVILGIPLFGFWGIIFGPLFISVFLLLIKIYYMEYKLIAPPTAAETKLVEKAEEKK